MYNIYILIYLLIYILPNANLLVIDNSMLSHLDRLYFKHNKRHKCLTDISHLTKFSFQNPLIIKSSHTYTFDSLEERSFVQELNTKKSQNSNPLFSVAKDSGLEVNEDSNPDVNRVGSEKIASRKEYKNIKGSRKVSHRLNKSGNLNDDDFEKWMFKDKHLMQDKISEYEEMMSQIKELSRSKEKKDKDLYSFIKKGLKESSTDPDIVMKTHDIMKLIERHRKLIELTTGKWEKYIKSIGMKPTSKLESLEKYVKIKEPVEYNIEQKAKEDSCGFRYPIEGSPEDIYTDANEYKIWARTPLSQSQNSHFKREHRGELEKESRPLEEMISFSHKRYEDKIKEDLESIRKGEFSKKMDNVLKQRFNGKKEGGVGSKLGNVSEREGALSDLEVKEEYKYRNEYIENYYEFFKGNFLKGESDRQDKMLRVLNRYNPWDEYVKMKNFKSSLPPTGVNYKVNLNRLRVSFRGNEEIARSAIRKFLREYLHYYLILRSDEVMFKEFKKSRFLYDILKYFDVEDELPVEKKKQFESLEDRFYKIYFPKECPDGFPKREPDPEFPLTLEIQKGLMALSEKVTGRAKSYHRVNMVCCLMALTRCYPLVRTYSADIFSEKRFKNIIEAIETGLSLELRRLDYGISEIEINNLNYKSLCQVDGVYLTTLTEILLQWNISRGMENLLDLVLLVTLRKMEEMDSKSLVTIVTNVTHLTTLPESVYINFLSKVVDFIHGKIKHSLVNREEYMDVEVALDLLKLLSRYPDVVNRQFMESFMQKYADSIINLWKNMDNNMKISLEKRIMEENKSLGSEILNENENFNKFSARKQLKDYCTSLQRYDETEEDMISMIESRRLQIFGLISCLQLSGMTEYMYLLNELTSVFSSGNFELNSMASMSVLRSFSECGDFQRRIVTRAKKSLIKDKYQLDAERIVEVLEAYVRGVKEGRLEPDSEFFFTMLRRFASLKDPDPETLANAARITDEFGQNLSSGQMFEIYRDLMEVPLCYNFLTRIGMRGELLEYPISTIAKVLYYASKNRVVVDKNWKTFYEIIYLFKHMLTAEDINLILDALIVSNFTKADKLLDILCKRVCNLIEISEVGSEEVLDIMNKCLELDYVPIQLLRFYTYSNLFELQNSGLIESLVEGPREYDVDFRGWKRPLSFDEHTEKIKMDHNMYVDVKMRGSRPILHETMKYSLQPTYGEPKHFEPVERKELDDNVLRSLANYYRRVKDLSYNFSESDSKLMNSLMSAVKAREISLINY